MSSTLHITVLMGGPDAEREVSLDSGRAVAQALRRSNNYHVTERVVDDSHAPLPVRNVDVFFPALHGPWGEGGPLQEMLEIAGIPYVGCTPEVAALCMDKWKTKQALKSVSGFQTPEAAVFVAGQECPIPPPVVLKPIDDGSSVDVHICRTDDELKIAQSKLNCRRSILAERYIQGRELTVGILCGEALPTIEIVPNVSFYDYDAKYKSDATKYIVHPQISSAHAQWCRDMALNAFRSLGCRDLARMDFMCDAAGPWFLEVNTMPGFTSHSLLPKAAAAAGIDFSQLCTRLIEAAIARR